MMIFAVFLMYISMYLIHNAYGSLCIIKNSEDNKSNDGDIETASRLYKVNNTNLFAVSNAQFLFCFAHFFGVLSQLLSYCTTMQFCYVDFLHDCCI